MHYFLLHKHSHVTLEPGSNSSERLDDKRAENVPSQHSHGSSPLRLFSVPARVTGQKYYTYWRLISWQFSQRWMFRAAKPVLRVSILSERTFSENNIVRMCFSLKPSPRKHSSEIRVVVLFICLFVFVSLAFVLFMQLYEMGYDVDPCHHLHKIREEINFLSKKKRLDLCFFMSLFSASKNVPQHAQVLSLRFQKIAFCKYKFILVWTLHHITSHLFYNTAQPRSLDKWEVQMIIS